MTKLKIFQGFHNQLKAINDADDKELKELIEDQYYDDDSVIETYDTDIMRKKLLIDIVLKEMNDYIKSEESKNDERRN